MPMIVFKNKYKDYDLFFGFNCEYDDNYTLKLKDIEPNDFDIKDYRQKIENAINNLNDTTLKPYLNEISVYLVALYKYLLTSIPSIYSIKFNTDNNENIFYTDEIKKI